MSKPTEATFKLKDSFVEKYKDIKPPFGFNGLGEIVYFRSYSRIKENGENEVWYETIRRVVEGTYRMQERHIKSQDLGWSESRAQKSAQEMYDRMFYMKFLPPGRGLWAMGSPITEERGLFAALNNCFGGDTKFLTANGTMRLDDASDKTVLVVCGDGEIREAIVRKFGVQHLNEITFKVPGKSLMRYSVEATPNHRWILADGTHTTNLSEGDRIALKTVHHTNNERPHQYQDGFRHGLIFGDGTRHTYYHNRFMIRLCGNKSKWADLFRSSPLFRSETIVGGDPFFTLVANETNLKELPDASSCGEYIAGFIQGWLAADSHQFSDQTLCLDTQNYQAALWLVDNAPHAGYVASGFSVENGVTNYGKRASSLNRIKLTTRDVEVVVETISDTGKVEEVFCVVEPVTHSFVLAGGLVTGNCAYVATDTIDKEGAEPFTFLMDASMLGVGVGFGVEGAGTVDIVEPKRSGVFVVPDNREGWVESVGITINAFLGRNDLPEFDYSGVRGPNMPIKGFGGVSSGPEPLIKLHQQLIQIFTANIGKPITITTIVDAMNLIGVCVVSGNVRRSAEIAIGPDDDEEFLGLKDYKWDSETQTYIGPRSHRSEWGWASNNTVKPKVGRNYKRLADRTEANGEPGYLWIENSRAYSRMCDPPDYKDKKIKGVNPCQPSYATVLTPEGISTIGDIKEGSVIWSGHGWTTVTKKWSTGIKPVYEYRTTTGRFIGTENHNIISRGERVEVKDAETIDYSVGPATSVKDLDSQDIMDGLVLGDGSIHRASNNLIYLLIGKKDRDYFDSEVAHLITKSRPGVTEEAYEIQTTITVSELPKTYNRNVPDRFYFGDEKKKCGFLRGLFTANGSISGNRVTLKQSSKALITSVQEMLSSLGIHSYITTNKSKTIEFSNGPYVCKQSYDLNITSGRSIFRDHIGFIQAYKQEKIEDGSKPVYLTSAVKSVDYFEDTEVFDITVDDPAHTYWTGGCLVSNCGEQPLEDRELCCLVETFPDNHTDLADYKRTLKFAYLYAKTVTLGKTHWPKTNRVMLRNRRIGTSMSGIAQFIAHNGLETLRVWCEEGYREIERYDKAYSDWFAVPLSIKKTSIKPSGSVSLVAGATPGEHDPEDNWYLRRVRMGKELKLLEAIVNAGYRFEPAEEDPEGTVVIEIPCYVDEAVRTVKQTSIWEKVARAAFLQRYWADNQVSCTASFAPEEGNQIEQVLNYFQYSLKGISFLPRLEQGAYAQMPYEAITKEEYEERIKTIRPFNITHLAEEAEQERGCDTDVCAIKVG